MHVEGCDPVKHIVPLLVGTAVLTLGLVTTHAQSGELPERRYPGAGVIGVSLRMPGDLHVERGAASQLVVQAEAKVLDKITITRIDGVLVIDVARGGFQTQRPITMRLTIPEVRSVHADSSGDIHLAPLKARTLRVHLEGAGSVEMERLELETLHVILDGSGDIKVGAGQVAEQIVSLDGSGDYQALRLDSGIARVKLDGSGSAHVRVHTRLEAELSGSGDIEYAGHPTVQTRIEGAGEVISIPAR